MPKEASEGGSRRVIWIAFFGNLAIAVTKFVAAVWTGSSGLMSEGVHSLIDTTNELLLLHGMRRSAEHATREHPLGHGRALYFWSFMVALLVFSGGAGVSFYEGIIHLLHPRKLEPGPGYVVLAVSAVFEGVSFRAAFKEFRRRKGTLSFAQAVHRSKDPSAFAVLLEDSAALVGLSIAFVGLLLADLLDLPQLDAAASLGIGLLLAGTAMVLARETQSLLIGESASQEIQASIQQIAASEPDVCRAHRLLTVHLAPDQIVAALNLELSDQLTTPEIERCVQRLEQRIREKHPQVVFLFVKPQAAPSGGSRASA